MPQPDPSSHNCQRPANLPAFAVSWNRPWPNRAAMRLPSVSNCAEANSINGFFLKKPPRETIPQLPRTIFENRSQGGRHSLSAASHATRSPENRRANDLDRVIASRLVQRAGAEIRRWTEDWRSPMPFYVQFSAPGRGLTGGKGRLHKMSYGYDPITPRNIVHMLFRMQVESGASMGTGQRQHKPLSITKEWSSSTPQILQGLATNEVLKTAPAPGGPPPNPIVVTKPHGGSTPQLFQALCNNEQLKTVIIKLLHVDASGGGGKEEVYYTITLTNASVLKYRAHTVHLPTPAGSGARRTASGAFLPGTNWADEVEEFDLVFSQIHVGNVSGSTSSSDSWMSNNK
jgi:type VI secretion system Hcp family effector